MCRLPHLARPTWAYATRGREANECCQTVLAVAIERRFAKFTCVRKVTLPPVDHCGERKRGSLAPSSPCCPCHAIDHDARTLGQERIGRVGAGKRGI